MQRLRVLDRFITPLSKGTPALPVALMRVMFGLIVLAHYLHWSDFLFPALNPDHGLGSGWFLRLGPELQWWLFPLWGLLMVAAIFMVIGFRSTRAVAIVFLIHSFFYFANPYMAWGWASIFRHFLFFLLFARPGEVLSIDSILRRDTRSLWEREVPRWPVLFMIAQLSLVYWSVLLNRMDVVAWLRGDAVNVILANGVFSRFRLDGIPLSPMLSVVASYLVLLIEAAGLFLLVAGRLRKYIAFLLIAFHLGLEATMLTGAWQWTVISGLLLCLPLEWYKVLLHKIYLVRSSGKREAMAASGSFLDVRAAHLLSVYFVAFVFLAGLSSIPKQFLRPSIDQTAEWAQSALQKVSLHHTSEQTMFANPFAQKSICYFVLGASGWNYDKMLYHSEVDECRDQRFRWGLDEFSQLLYRYDMPIVPKMSRSEVNQRRSVLGQYLCRLFSDQDNSVRKIYWGAMEHKYSRSPGQSGQLEVYPPHHRKVIEVDCVEREPIQASQSAYVLDQLKAYHRDYLKPFAGYYFAGKPLRLTSKPDHHQEERAYVEP